MKLRLFGSICLLLLSFLHSVGQRGDTHTLGAKPQQADTAKINVLLDQIAVLRETDPSKAMILCAEAISQSQQLGYHKGVGRASGSLGWIYYRRGDFVKALEYSIEALKISEKIGDLTEEASSLNNMAAIEHEQKDYERSMEHFRKALGIAVKTGNPKLISRSLNNIGHAFLLTLDNTDSANAYARMALALSENARDSYNVSYANYILGTSYARKGQSARSLTYYLRSLDFSDGISSSLKAVTWNQVAEAYINQNNLIQALPILNRNVETTSKFGYREPLARTYQLLSRLYQLQGKVDKSLDYLQRYLVLHDSIYNEQNSMKLATFQSQFELDLKQAQIELLTKDKQLNKEEISRQRIQLYATVGGMLGIFLIATLLFYVNRKINFANALLEKQKEILAHKNEEVELKSRELEIQADQLARLNTTKDKLFSIIGHDFRSPIHSLRGILELVENRNLSQQEFASVAGTLKINLDAVSTNLENLLQWSLTQLKGIQTNPTRICVHDLVREQVSLFNETAKVKSIQLQNEIAVNRYAYADEDHTRLVLRNLINNAIKFTRPGGVITISCLDEGPYIKILVADNGVGIESSQLRSLFNKEKLPTREGTNREKGVGIGLMLCQEFVENNGGQLSAASEPGKGSVFAFTLKAA